MSVFTAYLEDILKSGKDHTQFTSSELSWGKLENLAPGIIKCTPKQISGSLASSLILSCGVHGNETAPIEIMNDILRDLAEDNFSLKRPCLIIFGHLAAMRVQKRFIDFNMNRLFCGLHEKYPDAQESARAKLLEEHVSLFCEEFAAGHHYDLHTAIRPSHLKRFAVFPTEQEQEQTQVSALDPNEVDDLKNMGIEGILVSGGKASTFSAYTYSVHKAKGYTVELGKVEPFGKNDRSHFQKVEKFLRASLEGKTMPKPHGTLKIYTVDHEMIRDSEDYILHIAEDYANFAPLKEGQKVETTLLGTLVAKEAQAVVFPNSQVVIGQRTGLLVNLVKEL